MEFMKLAAARESCRRYMNTPVKRELLDHMIEAARLAPSASNAQPWRYVVVDNPAKVQALAPLCRLEGAPNNAFTDGVPAFIVAIERPVDFSEKYGDKILRKNYSELDIGLSLAHMTLAAAELGLGTCILGLFQEAKIKELLQIPDDHIVRLVVTVGHPAPGDPRPKKRLDTTQIAGYNSFTDAMK